MSSHFQGYSIRRSITPMRIGERRHLVPKPLAMDAA